VIAAVLYLHEHPRQALLKSFQKMRRHLVTAHDVGDRDLFLVAMPNAGAASNATRAWRQPRRASCRHCRDAIDSANVGEHPGLRSAPRSGQPRSAPAAAHASAGESIAAPCATASWCRATVETMVSVSPALAARGAITSDSNALEPAAEGDDVDTHLSDAGE